MSSKQKAQRELILRHLESGETITPIDALNEYRCFRLAAVVCVLRKEGYNIKTLDDNNSYATYELQAA